MVRSAARSPSLLTGLVFDDSGERMTPTHANKKGTRYRYYISQSLIQRGRRKASDASCRVPAADLETLVSDRILALLRDEAAVIDATEVSKASIGTCKAVVADAADLARRWPELRASDKRAILHALVARIEVRAESVDIAVRLAALPAIAKRDRDLRRLPVLTETSSTTLSVPAKVKRTGMETRMLIHGSGPARRDPDRSLLRLLGQARRFNALIMDGSGAPVSELAANAGVCRSLFTRVFRLSFLSPEITKAILQGRQPPELSAHTLMLTGKLAQAWSGQRRQLGLD